ncbi:uncharacterized protein LOC144438341 isoform X1 [Glandiceps talaboti]
MAESGSESETEICEVQTILARRKVEGEYEYLIRWKGFDSSEDSWEPEDHLIDCKDVLHEFLLSLNNAKIVHPKTPPPRSTKKSAKKNDMSTSTSKTTIQSTRETRQRKLQTPIVSKSSAVKSRSSTKSVKRVTTSTYTTSALSTSSTTGDSSSSKATSVLSDTFTAVTPASIRSRTSSLFSSTVGSATPYIRPMSELKRPPIKHNGYFSTGKVTGSAKAVRRTLEMKPQQSFLHRHQWWICYFFILFIVSSVAAALAWRIYTHKPQQQNV